MPQGIVLKAAGALAELLPHAGGRIASLMLTTRSGEAIPVLHSFPADGFDPAGSAKGGMFPLVPYSNLIAQAKLRVGTRELQLVPRTRGDVHLLHGNAQAQAWRVLDRTLSSAALELHSPASGEWPWRYVATMGIRLAASCLCVDLSLRNVDKHTMPAGLGLHPYFLHGPGATLRYGVGSYWPTSRQRLPLCELPAADKENSLWLHGMASGHFSGHFGQWEGCAEIGMAAGAILKITADPVFGHLVVHRPDPPLYLCVEPVSHVANGFNLAAQGVSNTGTRLLAPGEVISGQIKFELLEADARSLRDDIGSFDQSGPAG